MNKIVVVNGDDLRFLIAEAVSEALSREPKLLRGTLTLRQLSEQWQCSKQSILNWIDREKHPLPVRYIGSDPRFDRHDVDHWSKENARRKREVK